MASLLLNWDGTGPRTAVLLKAEETSEHRHSLISNQPFFQLTYRRAGAQVRLNECQGRILT